MGVHMLTLIVRALTISMSRNSSPRCRLRLEHTSRTATSLKMGSSSKVTTTDSASARTVKGNRSMFEEWTLMMIEFGKVVWLGIGHEADVAHLPWQHEVSLGVQAHRFFSVFEQTARTEFYFTQVDVLSARWSPNFCRAFFFSDLVPLVTVCSLED